MPWTLLLPGAIYAAVKVGRVTGKQARFLASPTVDMIRLLGCWFGLTLVSVAFYTRQDY